ALAVTHLFRRVTGNARFVEASAGIADIVTATAVLGVGCQIHAFSATKRFAVVTAGKHAFARIAALGTLTCRLAIATVLRVGLRIDALAVTPRFAAVFTLFLGDCTWINIATRHFVFTSIGEEKNRAYYR
ncbi:MAG: hypothetical protein CSA75_04125, partial [Sorangium cellulosum]